MPTINLGRVGIVNKGAYVGGTTVYKVNDIVTYNFSVYICIQAHSTQQLPTVVTYWTPWIDSTNLVHRDSNETITGVKTFSAQPVGITQASVGLSNVTNESKATMFTSPVFTGNVTGLGVATGTSFNAITGLSSTSPAMDGTATVGTSATVARADHIHPTDTTKANVTTTVAKDSDAGAAVLPAGTTAQRPASPVNGYMRYNSDLLAMEAYVNGAWGSTGTPVEVVTHAATSKVTPVDADELGLVDSVAFFGLKKITWGNIKTALASLFAPLASPAFTGTPTAPNFSYKPTPVIVTSWSYATTTITLNVASHTFVAGDYIEVGGLTATTNIPNGVYLVTSVTATTIVFTHALTPTGTTGVSSATVKGYMTTNGRVESIGVGQTWVDVTASRALGTTYTNTTGKPKVLSIVHTLPINVSFSININGYSVITGGMASSAGSLTGVAIVPNGATYLASGGTLYRWMELA